MDGKRAGGEKSARKWTQTAKSAEGLMRSFVFIFGRVDQCGAIDPWKIGLEFFVGVTSRGDLSKYFSSMIYIDGKKF